MRCRHGDLSWSLWLACGTSPESVRAYARDGDTQLIFRRTGHGKPVADPADRAGYEKSTCPGFIEDRGLNKPCRV